MYLPKSRYSKFISKFKISVSCNKDLELIIWLIIDNIESINDC